ncbi:hypothetical protein D3C71_1546590 [compost metagenome]
MLGQIIDFSVRIDNCRGNLLELVQILHAVVSDNEIRLQLDDLLQILFGDGLDVFQLIREIRVVLAPGINSDQIDAKRQHIAREAGQYDYALRIYRNLNRTCIRLVCKCPCASFCGSGRTLGRGCRSRSCRAGGTWACACRRASGIVAAIITTGCNHRQHQNEYRNPQLLHFLIPLSSSCMYQ